MVDKRNPVEHVTDGTRSWVDELGFFVRLRGQSATLLTTILLGGAPWWWPEKLGTLTIHIASAISITILTIGLTLVGALYYLRSRTIRSLSMKRELHLLAHFLRDEHISIKSKTTNPDIYRLSEKLCERIREYTSILIHRKHEIGVAIRIAAPSTTGVVYKTVGRAGLNQHRHSSSSELPADIGVARLMSNDKGRQGVIIYHDLTSAKQAGAYIEQENDRKFPEDIKTFMVAPINGWDGEKNAMIGLLYITSPVIGTFQRKHTDAVGFVSDSIAIIFSELAISNHQNTRETQRALF